ncbi:MAG: NAD-dependent epimerase/dehydratase family protein [Alphaproteobacteria bacterium]|nr:NAD-dependent epimerase/dehydratase family protein [Alphaproteobacteria bacterium]
MMTEETNAGRGATIGAGFVGAGYIASWHAAGLRRVPGVRLAGVFDAARAAADAFAAPRGVRVFGSLDELLSSPEIDCVHVLTPPASHYAIARKVVEAGKHCFVEKPMTLEAGEARALADLAKARGVALGVNHNFLMLPGYERLRKDVEAGVIGPADSFAANWRYAFAPLRSGPYGMWMLREPQNMLFEIGAHLYAFLADLFENFETRDVLLRYPIEMPGGVTQYQGWRISGLAGETAATIDISLIEGHDERMVELRGLGAAARVDFANDAYVLSRAPMGDIIAGPLGAQLSLAGQAVRTGAANAVRQAASLNDLAPYGLSITRACQSFYASLAGRAAPDRRLGADLAARSIAMMAEAAAKAAPQLRRRASVTAIGARKKPTMLVIGGAGFIGRPLVAMLADRGFGVRVFSRGKPTGFERADGRVELFTGDLKSESDLLAAMDGIEGVFHLARATENDWDGYLRNDVAVTRLIGECCIKAGVKRLVYTGTIDSYDASRPDRPITEETPFEHLEERNLYARSKAACEAALTELAAEKGLPLVIARPAIVIGKGGPLQHWGIAMWRGATSCRLWGDGANIYPFVSVEDCADGLVRTMTTPGVEGRSFNLVGEPLLSAKEYFSEIGRFYGVEFRAAPTPIWSYYATDLVKYWAKRLLARKKNVARPSYRDWKSRAKLSTFRNDAAKTALGWAPETDRARFVRSTIVEANLFGVGVKNAPSGGGAAPAAEAPQEAGEMSRAGGS